ncbi:MAG: alpha/beta hydrolase [Gemmatimonadaceae bacterium]
MILAALVGAVIASGVQAPADTVRDTVFVASNRRRVADGFTRQVVDSIWYGVYVTQLVTQGGPARALAPMHVQRVDSAALTAGEWRDRLIAASRDTSARGAALLYVHGYSTSPGRAVAQGVQVKARAAHAGPLVVFLWPTHDRYVTLPTPSRAYSDDAAAAARSGGALASVIRMIDSVVPSMVLVAHSMGSRVALHAVIGDSATRRQLAAHPLRAFGLFSPDASADRFRDDYAPHLREIAGRVALYSTSNDYLLAAATLVNGARRAGRFAVRGPELQGIELVDVTRGERADPVMLRLFGPRHAVRWASAALADFFGIVVAGAPDACRTSSGEAIALGEGRWRLRPRAMLDAWLDASCTPQHAAGPAR